MLFDQSDVRNICTDCCGQSERQPPLMLRATAIQTGLCQMVSYLIVRLEMQYFHIAFHTAVTSLEASDMPEKNAHGTERKFERKKKVPKTQNCSNSPKRARRSTVCAHSLLNHKLHPTSFTFHRKPTKKFILLLLKLLSLCLFLFLPAPVYVGLRVAALASCLMTK